MISVKHRTAEALAPTLSIFHSVGDRPLRAVWQIYTEGSLDRLVLDFGDISLTALVDEDDDSIDITVAATADPQSIGGMDASSAEPWNKVIGKAFGWGWVMVNQQGYCDGLLLSFDGIFPQIVLNVIASSIKVGTVSSSS